MPLVHTPSELAAWLRLALEPGIGPATARELLGAFGPPEELYALTREQLAARLPDALAARLAAPPSAARQAAVQRALQWAAQPGHHVLTLADAGYPRALLDTHDPPTLLYVIGRPELLARPALAIVGARNATPEGLGNARAYARHLAARGWCIVSGLALGIDAAAHEGALAAGPRAGGTIAVIGTGADIVYPARHRALARRIAAAGAIVSELPLGTPALPHQFPKRNRLVAGLARGTLVAEAAAHSGSLITARLAAENGREVFAIPGSIHSPLARGCHALIRQGAKLVETAQDILDELGTEPLPSAPLPSAPLPSVPLPSTPLPSTPLAAGLAIGAAIDAITGPAIDPAVTPATAPPPDRDDPVLAALGYGPVHVDDLARRAGCAMQALQARLLDLELAGRIDRLPGGRYQRRAVQG